jgi:hypothetical protein
MTGSSVERLAQPERPALAPPWPAAGRLNRRAARTAGARLRAGVGVREDHAGARGSAGYRRLLERDHHGHGAVTSPSRSHRRDGDGDDGLGHGDTHGHGAVKLRMTAVALPGQRG